MSASNPQINRKLELILDKLDEIGIDEPTSLFDDTTTIERTSLVDLTSSFGTSIIRDEITSIESGSISEDPADSGEIELSTGMTPNSTITLSSASYGRNTPGYSAQVGIGIRFPVIPTSGEVLWGYYDDTNGYYFGYDGEKQELFVARIDFGVELNRVYRSDWNGKDIEEVLGFEWDITDGSIFQIDFSWYGYGIIVFQLVQQSANSDSPSDPKQKTIRLHALAINQDATTSDPNQPVRIEANNHESTEDIRVRVGGRQFSVFGQEPEGERITSDTKSGITVPGNSWGHVMSWRRKGSDNANARLNVRGVKWSAGITSRYAIVVGANLSGLNFETPSLTNPDETLLEVSFEGTFDDIGDGTKQFEDHLNAGSVGNASGSVNTELNISFGQNKIVSLVAYGIEGSGSALATMRLSEDW